MSRKINPNVQVHCPVCGQNGHGKARCARCDADLQQLMVVTAHAYVAREAARHAIHKGNFAQAYRLAQKAQAYRRTQAGDRLMKLALMCWDVTF